MGKDNSITIHGFDTLCRIGSETAQPSKRPERDVEGNLQWFWIVHRIHLAVC